MVLGIVLDYAIVVVYSGADPGIRKGGGHSLRRRPGEGAGGGTPPAQLGGMGERCKLPHRGLGRSPRSQRVLRCKSSEKAGLLNSSYTRYKNLI